MNDMVLNTEKCKELICYFKKESRTVSFLSEIEICEDDMEFLLSNFNSIVMYGFSDNEERVEYNILIAYVLVYIGMSEYDDGKYWPFVDDVLKWDYNQNDHEDLFKSFKSGILQLGLKMPLHIPSQYQQILVHSFVSDKQEYMDRFFSFVWHYYAYALNHELPDENGEDFRKLSEYVRSTLGAENQPSAKSDTDYPDLCKLLRYTRYSLTEPEMFGELLYKIIRIMDSGSRGDDSQELLNTRFSKPFQRWYMENIGYKSRRDRREAARLRKARIVLNDFDYKPAIEIPVMNCTKNATVQFILNKKTYEPGSEDQPRIMDLPGSAHCQMHSLKRYAFDTLPISPFDAFKIKFDNRVILTNKNRSYVIFDKNLSETIRPSCGINYILLNDKSNPNDLNGNVHIEPVAKSTYGVELSDGDFIQICGDEFQVIDDDLDSINQLVFKQESNVVAIDSTGSVYPLVNDLSIKCKLSDVSAKTRIIETFSVDDGPQFEQKIQIQKCNMDSASGLCSFVLPKDMLPMNEIHKFHIAVKKDDMTVDSIQFVLIPNHSFSFNTANGYYHNTKIGKLSIYGPIEDTIIFNTRDQKVEYIIPSQSGEYRITHTIPSILISIDGGNNWKGPTEYDACLDDLLQDNIQLICPTDVGVYSPKPLPCRKEDSAYIVDISQFKMTMKADLSKEYELSLSVNHKPRIKIMAITTHNEYNMTNDGNGITIDIKRKTRNKSYCCIKGMITPEMIIELNSEHNTIALDIQDHTTVSIIEKDRRGIDHKIMSKEYGSDIQIAPIPNGYQIAYQNNSISLFCSENNLNSFENSFKSAMRFNPWMKPSKVWEDVKHAYVSMMQKTEK